MLVNLKQILEDACKNNYAVGSFNTPTLENVRAVISAAEELDVPVIIAHAEVHESIVPVEVIGPVMLEAAKRAKVPVCVHLDHGVSYDLVIKAMKLGFTSVMIDCSALPFEENIAITKKVVEEAGKHGVSVEAELGEMPQPEGSNHGSDVQENASDHYTDPDKAGEFVRRTGVDALAVAFGTAHGLYAKVPNIDFNRLEKIHQKTAIPLVMHGGSGVSDEGFQEAISKGIRKINYYTYMAKAGGDYVKNRMDNSSEPIFYHDITGWAIEGIKQDAIKAMKVFR